LEEAITRGGSKEDIELCSFVCSFHFNAKIYLVMPVSFSTAVKQIIFFGSLPHFV